MNEWTIRPAAEVDWPSIGPLAEVLVRTHYAFDPARFFHPDTLRGDVYTAHLREEIAGGHATVLVADTSGAILGYVFVAIEPESWKEFRYEAGFVHDLVVDEHHRHAGIGAALLASAIEWIRARGVTRVTLGSAAPNTGAQELFRRAGFRPTMIEMTLR